MLKCFRIAIPIFFFAFITGCSSPLPVGTTPVQVTWLHGNHAIPAQYLRNNTDKYWRYEANWMDLAGKEVKADVKVPVVLFLHGCSGIKSEEITYQAFLLKQGYAVFMPDSFARSRLECGQQGSILSRIKMRTEEVANAVKELKKLSWVDQSNIILMGFSEGGNATDNWSTPGFKAHIILGSACTTNTSRMPNAPEDVPVLAIVGEKDSYRPGESCTITRTIGGSRSVVIPKADHWIANYRETQEAIKTFIGQCCKQ